MMRLIVFLFLICCKFISTASSDTGQPLVLWYNQPAKVWEEALPLGNGTTGAMVWGRVLNEHYSLNDHTLWSGGPVGQQGQVQEWFKDWDDPNDTHRHISHLFSLYPGNQISLENTPELARAAKETLRERGDVSTGWSMAWKINWWARLKDGDHALKILKDGLTYIGAKKAVMGGGGTYANLFDAHPPFQIDGNFGGTAGIAEMLVQSHEGFIHLLPALPKEWPDGEVKGLVARGGFVIDIKGHDGRLTSAVIHSKLGGDCRVKTADEISGKGFQLGKASGESKNPLLQKPRKVPFINQSKVAEPELLIPVGTVYEWGTVAGQNYEIRTNN